MCGGIISESLVQMLSSEGIILPPTVVQRGIDSYMLHTDLGTVRIDTPTQEKRIGAVYRGSGPRDIKEIKWGSFDGHVQSLAIEKGANVIQERVSEFDWDKAARLAEPLTGLKYSGQYGFAETAMYWPLSHMIAPKSRSLQCAGCHGENGRMDWQALGYDGDPYDRGGRRRAGGAVASGAVTP